MLIRWICVTKVSKSLETHGAIKGFVKPQKPAPIENQKSIQN